MTSGHDRVEALTFAAIAVGFAAAAYGMSLASERGAAEPPPPAPESRAEPAG